MNIEFSSLSFFIGIFFGMATMFLAYGLVYNYRLGKRLDKKEKEYVAAGKLVERQPSEKVESGQAQEENEANHESEQIYKQCPLLRSCSKQNHCCSFSSMNSAKR